MKKILLQIYLVIEYLIALAWFTIGMFLNIFVLALMSPSGLEHRGFLEATVPDFIKALTIIVLFSIFVSLVFIKSIGATKRLIKNESLKLIEKISLLLMPIIAIWLTILYIQ